MKGFVAALVLIGTASGCFAQEYRGADKILQAAAAASEKPPKGAENADNPVKLKRDLKAFRENARNMAPEQAAKEWLGYVDRFANLKVDRETVSWIPSPADDLESNVINFDQVVAAMPPSAAWDALARTLETRTPDKNEMSRTLLLRAMAHWLVGNVNAAKKDLGEFQQQPKSQNSSFFPSITNEFQWALIQNSDNGADVLAYLKQRLQSDVTADYPNVLQVPDLVTLVGEQKATEFLREALRSARGQIRIGRGDATKKLARKLALGMVNEMKAAQWGLVDSLDATALYEAMAKRFPETDRDRYEKPNAQMYYVLGLIAAHRATDAAAFTATLGDNLRRSLPEQALSALERAGYTGDLAHFFHDVLEKNPDLPLWDEYVRVAAKASEGDKMVALAEASAARTGLTAKQRRTILTQLHRAYLAADKIDKGIEILRQEIAADKADNAPADQNSEPWYSSECDDAGLSLMGVGEALGRTELIDEGESAIRTAPAVANDTRERTKRANNLNRLATQLIGLNRMREAEDVLADALIVAPDPAKVQYSSPSQPETLGFLVALYRQANRPNDILTLLTSAPQWCSRDLVNLLSQTASVKRNSEYIALFVADALLQTGHGDEAHKIVDAIVDQHGGYDPVYEYLIKLEGTNAIARLDRLFARDQFEERPLVWKAKLLLDSGKLEEAEKCARQAITIDPSDGEEGPGRRMIVYSVLADIRERRGDAKEAEMLRGAVTAIRHSEEADRFYNAGLITRAVKMYEEALSHFADAYCIQSRLALRLAELGDMAGAEEHYRRAYELMPDSFGRVESHCFGCERAFDGQKAQSIAEKVFTELAAKRPDKPQVHYLLGYLRKAQERYAEALPEFRAAVKLDPEYLSAWKELAETGEKIHLPSKEREAIELTKLRLDPVGHHSSFRINDMVDLRAAWTALEDAQKIRPKKPETLFPLTASAEEVQKREQTRSLDSNYRVYVTSDSADARLQPGATFAQHSVMQAIARWFNAALRSR